MRRLTKRVAVALLRIGAAAQRAAAPLRRLWAHARLAAAIDSPLDPSVVVLGTAEVHGSGAVRAGRNAYLYAGLHLETQGAGRIVLGDDVVLSRGVHLVSFARVSVGAGTIVGEYSSVRDANHRFGAGIERVRDSGHDSAPIEIGRNVWIGRGVTVLPGVRIGDGAVIGANAVVTKSVPAGAVFGGVPARPLRLREAA